MKLTFPVTGRKTLDTWLLPDNSTLQGAYLLAAFTAILAFFFFVSEMLIPLKHDMVEAYSWGMEFQFGYHQHPPFWAWLCGFWFSVFPSTPFFFALLSAANAAIGLWATWRLTGELIKNPEQRLAARALSLLVLQAAGTCPPRPLARAAVNLVSIGSLGLVLGTPAFLYWRVHTQRWTKQIPFAEIAREGTRLWQEYVHTPLTYVAGSAPYSDFVTFYSPAHPHSFPWHDRNFALWVTPERIRQHGLLSVCESNDSSCLGAASLYATASTVRIPLAVAHHFGHYEGRMYNFTLIITPPVVQ